MRMQSDLSFLSCSHLSKLSLDSSGRNSHHYRLHRSNFIAGDSLFLGYAEVVLHSGVATHSHGRSEVNHKCGLRVKNLVVTR